MVAVSADFQVETKSRVQFLDITDKVRRVVRDSGCKEGLCHVYVPHTTAAITVNEGADPDVTRDIMDRLDKLVPQDDRYRHAEGNADSHIRSTIVGSSQILPVRGGDLALGAWQSLFFCEFDGPRKRKVLVTLSSSA